MTNNLTPSPDPSSLSEGQRAKWTRSVIANVEAHPHIVFVTLNCGHSYKIPPHVTPRVGWEWDGGHCRKCARGDDAPATITSATTGA